MKTFNAIFFLVAWVVTSNAVSAQDGEQLFKTNCASCHMFGKRLVGPDLTGVTEKRDEQWLLKWIKSSQTLVKEGDSTAVQLFNEYNKIPMPDAFINEEQIKSVLAFIKTKKAESAQASAGNQITSNTGVTNGTSSTTVIEPNVNLLNMFSFSEYLLIFLCAIMLVVIWILVRTIKSLSTQLTEKYKS